MKRIIEIVLCLILMGAGSSTLQAQTYVIFEDDFSNNLTQDGWRQLMEPSASMPFTSFGDLPHAGYATVNGTYRLQLNGSYGGIVHSASTDLGGTSVYAAFVLQVLSATGTDEMIMNFVGSPDVTLKDYGLVVKHDGLLRFGLRVDGTNAYLAGGFNLSNTYLIVVKYNSASRVYSLFVNPSLASEPAADLDMAAHAGTAAPYLSQIQFTQRSGVNAEVDFVRVVSTWSDLTVSTGGLLYSESFNDGGGMASHGWNDLQCCANFNVTGGLSYGGFGNGQAAQTQFSTGSYQEGLGTTISSGTVYLSFLIADNNCCSSNNSNANVNFYNTNDWNWNFEQGLVLNNGQISIKNGPQSFEVVNSFISVGSTGSPTFVVLAYNIDSKIYSLYINPPLNQSSPPGGPNITTASANTVSSIAGVTLIQPHTSSQPVYDELRVSTSWADVVKSPMTSSDPDPVAGVTVNPNTGSIDGNFMFVPDADGYVVVRGEGSPPSFTPVDGQTYFDGQIFGSDEVVESGPSTNFNDNGLTAGETYFYKVYSYEGTGVDRNYAQHSPGQDIAVAGTPGIVPNMTFTGRTESSLSFNLSTSASLDGNIVFRQLGAASPPDAQDGNHYYVGWTNGGVTVVYMGSGSSFTDTGLLPNTNYTYRVHGFSGISSFFNATTSSDIHSDNTLPSEPSAQPSNLTFSGVFETSMTLNFTPVGDAYGYLVIRRENASPTGSPVDGQEYFIGNPIGDGIVAVVGTSGGSLTVGGLNPETIYFFDMYSYNLGSGLENYRHASPPLEGLRTTIATSPGSPPTTLGFNTHTQTTFNVTWNSAGANTLVIRRQGLSPDSGSPVDGTNYIVGNPLNNGTIVHYGPGSSVSQSGLIAGQTYYYDLYKFNGTGLSSNYYDIPLEGSTITVPPTPTTNGTTAIGETVFTANWNLQTGATSYRVDVANNPGFSPMIHTDLPISSPTNFVIVNTSLAPGTTYYWRVSSVNASGVSPDSPNVTLLTAPAAPVALEETLPTQQTIFQANWNASATATSYLVDVSLVNNFATFVHQNLSVGTTFTIINTLLNPGTTYYYRVRASNGAVSGNSGTITVVTVPPNPVATAATAVNQTTFNATWNAATSADNYRLDVNTSPGFGGGTMVSGFNNLTTGNVTSVPVTGLTQGTTYYYQVRATSAASGTGISGNSNAITTLTLPGTPVIAAATSIGTTGFTANWTAGPGGAPANYRLDVATDAGFTAFVSGYNNTNVGSGLSSAVTGLASGTQYHYRVKSENATGVSPVSGSNSPVTLCVAPTVTAGSGSTTSAFNANWNTVTGAPAAANYRLDVDDDPLFGSMLLNNITPSSSTSHTVSSGLAAGTTYYWRVRALNSASAPSASSANGSHMTLTTAPVGSAATAITASSFSANWTTTTGAASYRLDVATDAGFSSILGGYNNLDVGNVLTYSVTGLNPGTTYHYRLRGVNIGGTSASTASPIAVTTVPPVPVPAAATLITTTTFTANWSASATANNYRIDIATDPTFAGGFVGSYNNFTTGNVTTLAVTGFAAGTTYYYRLRAVSAAGTSASSSNITVLMVPPNPTIGAADQLAQTSFRANWTAATGAASYKLDVATNSGFTGAYVTGYQDLTVGAPPFVVNTNLTAGTTYYYRVRAVNTGGTSGNSAASNLTTIPPNPVASAATSFGTTAFTANWAASTTATSYFLDVARDNGFTDIVTGWGNVAVGNVLTHNVNTNLTAGTNYYYRVRANSASGLSGNSNTITLITVSNPPAANAADNFGQTSFRANWTAATGAASYRIDVATNSGFTGAYVTGYQDVDAGTGTSFTVNTNLTAGTTYHYRVRSVNVSGVSPTSSNIIAALTSPPNPTSTAASGVAQTSFTANWNASTSATDYLLDVSTDGFNTFVGSYNGLSVGNVTSASVTGLNGGTAYEYRIIAINSSGQSGFSGAQSVLTIPDTPTANDATFITISSFIANWSAATGAASYRLDVSTDNFSTTIPGYGDLSVAGTSSSVTGLSEGVTYTYRVRAVNAGGTSANSNIISVVTVPPVPTALAATAINANGFTANWSLVTGATTYSLDVSVDDFASFVPGYNGKTLTNTSEAISGLNQNTTYKYRVRATSSSGTSANSGIITVLTHPDAPASSAATAVSQSGFTANWLPVAGISSYRLDLSTDDFATFVTGHNDLTVTATSLVITGLDPGVTYKYRVRAVNATAPSANSSDVSIATIPATPVASAASAVTTTGFTINWPSVTGAASYSVDVSLDDFATFITGYNGAVVTTADPVAVTGLTHNTSYKYRVRSTNASGSSPNSTAITVVTFPNAPVAIAATLPLQNGFTANWQVIAGITDFKLDVSSDDFATRVAGFDDLTVTGTSKAVTGLTAGVTYKYRLRAVNAAGSSANSNAVATITVPANPTIPVTASSPAVTTTTFSFGWPAIAGADAYLVDVATAATFASNTFLTGFNRLESAATSIDLTGLTAGTNYYCRVKSKNTSGESGFSPVLNQITVPVAPITIPQDAAELFDNRFVARWNPVIGADHYEIDVTLATGTPFSTFVSGYNALVVPDGETDQIVSGLPTATDFYFRVRAVNDAGKSVNSQRRFSKTSGSQQSFTVTITSTNNVQFSGTDISVQGQVTAPAGTPEADLIYRGIAATTEVREDLPIIDGAYTVVIRDNMLDEIGVEFYVEVTDEAPQTKQTAKQRIYRAVKPDVPIPSLTGTALAGDRTSMRIIAIPYQLEDNDIENIFVSLGQYDKKSWRMAHYEDGANAEYQNGLLKVERGLGYWFNARGNLNVRPGAGIIPPNNTDNPYSMTLQDGWNQIGNPYPFAIDWSDVLVDNASVASSVGNLFTWDGTTENFVQLNTLPPFSGGFVRSNGAQSLNVRVTLKGTAGGREKDTWTYDIGEDTWMLPLSLTQKSSTFSLGAVGMAPEASAGFDNWDELRLPSLDEYLDITFDHQGEKFKNLMRDVVTTANEANWKFFAQSSGADEEGTLSWDNTRFGNSIAQVYLFDVANLQMIDMSTTSFYSFRNPGKKEFRIYYRRDGRPVVPDLQVAGAPYPNPSSDNISVMVALPQGEFATELVIFDQLGRQVGQVQKQLRAGVHELSWDGNDQTGDRARGLYFVRVRANNQWLHGAQRVVMK